VKVCEVFVHEGELGDHVPQVGAVVSTMTLGEAAEYALVLPALSWALTSKEYVP
jgi:hypothetical protein